MKKILKVIKRLVALHKNRALPQTEPALEALVQEVLELGGFPLNDSFRHSIATQIMHLDNNATSVRASSFINTLKRSIANQVAFNIIQDTKERQKNEKTVKDAAGGVG